MEIPDQLAGEMEAAFQEEPPSLEETAADAAASAQPVTEKPASSTAVEEKPAPVQETPRGARILGRIDLRRAARVEPAPTPVARRPVPGATAAPSSVQTEVPRPARDGEAAKPERAEGYKPAKAGRHKKRVVKKQDVLEFREKELRAGRIPRKKRALPGKEQRKTEITIPRASKRVIKISEVITVGDLARDMGVKAGE